MNIKYPKNEIVWVTYYTREEEPVFVLTSKEARDYYYLYEIAPDGKLIKLGKSSSPAELERKYKVVERMKERGGVSQP